MIKIDFGYFAKLLLLIVLIFIFSSDIKYANSQSYTVPLPETPEFEYLAISITHPKLIGSSTIRTPTVILTPEFEGVLQFPSLNRKTIGIKVTVQGKKIFLKAIATYCNQYGGVYHPESNTCELCIAQVDPYNLQLWLSAKSRGGWVIEKGSLIINNSSITTVPSNRTTEMFIPISKPFEITNCDIKYITRVKFTIIKTKWWAYSTETLPFYSF